MSQAKSECQPKMDLYPPVHYSPVCFWGLVVISVLGTVAMIGAVIFTTGCSHVDVTPTSPVPAVTAPTSDSVQLVIDSLEHDLCIARLLLKERTYSMNCYQEFIRDHGLEVPPECSGHPIDPRECD